MTSKNNDFNGDGKSDVLFQHAGGQIAVWLGGPTALVDSGTAVPVTATFAGTGDFNGDGKADILLQNASGMGTIRTMDGTTPTGSQTILQGSSSDRKIKGIGDFDGDGKDDILLQQGRQMQIQITGDTTVSNAGASLATGWEIKGVGDFNADGKSDIILQYETGLVEIWNMNGNRAVSYQYLPSNPGTAWEVKDTGDFNGDGKSDLLLQHTNGQMAITLTGAGLVNVGAALDGGWQIKTTGDWNGDGKDDIFLQHASGVNEVWHMNGTTVEYYQGLGKIRGSAWQMQGETNEPRRTLAWDFNGDGRTDMLFRNAGGQLATRIVPNQGVTHTGPALNAAWQVKASGDYDYDGKADIFLQHTDGTVEIWTMNSVTRTSVLSPGANPGAAWEVKRVGDFNNDGRTDMLLQNSGTRQMATWIAGTAGPVNTGAALDAGWEIKATGDYNGDGKTDIGLQHSSGVTEVWLMNGIAPVAYQPLLPNQGAAYQVKAMGDFNSDGKADVLMQHTNGKMWAWLGGASSLSEIGAALDSSWTIKGTGDFNADGKGDIFLQHTGGTVETWVLNGTSPTNYSQFTPGNTWAMIAQ